MQASNEADLRRGDFPPERILRRMPIQSALGAAHGRLTIDVHVVRVSRLLKKSLRLRNEECRRDFLQAGAAHVRGFGPPSGHCSVAFHAAGRSSPLGAISLGRRTML